MNTNVKHNQSAEDYLESILLISESSSVVHRIDVAKYLGVSQAAVNKAVKILVDKGYVYEEGKHLYLTKSGEDYARAVFERHCVIREFLLSLGVSATTAEQDACKMEHLLSEETLQMMKFRLKNKENCDQ